MEFLHVRKKYVQARRTKKVFSVSLLLFSCFFFSHALCMNRVSLYNAVVRGSESEVRILLDQMIHGSHRSRTKGRASGDYKYLEACLMIRDKYGQTMLHHAAYANYLSIARVLIDQMRIWGEKYNKPYDVVTNFIDARDHDGRTALQLAAARNNIKMVNYLVSLGADFNRRLLLSTPAAIGSASKFFTPAFKSAMVLKRVNREFREFSVQEYILSLRATDLHKAVAQRNFRLICDCVFSIAFKEPENLPGYINARDDFARTPLHLAARNDDLQTVRFLMLFGANILAFDTKGCVPLDYASGGSVREYLAGELRERNNVFINNRQLAPDRTPLLLMFALQAKRPLLIDLFRRLFNYTAPILASPMVSLSEDTVCCGCWG